MNRQSSLVLPGVLILLLLWQPLCGGEPKGGPAGRGKPPTVRQEPFGTMPDGAAVAQFTLGNAAGLKIRIINYGATIVAVETPDRDGKLANITLNRDTLEQYLAGPLLGSVVGRYANRIAKASFIIDATEYPLTANSRRNHIHGGKNAFHKQLWQAEPIQAQDMAGVKLRHESPDGDEGYPGKLSVTVTYALTSANELRMEYRATTDKPTHVNLSNHAYWNLAGAGARDVLDHELTLNADRFLPVDEEKIPLGQLQSVRDTPLDFTVPRAIGARIGQLPGGYDHCYVLNKGPGKSLSLAARLVEPASGRTMEVHTTQPGVQLYTANGLKIKDQDGKLRYGNHDAVCLETQHYPDSPHHPEFPSTLLRPGDTYLHVTVHKFGVRKSSGQ